MIRSSSFLTALIAVCLGAWSCADFGVAPRWQARLAIVPVFSGANPQDGVAADVDSFVVTISNPPAAPVTGFVRVAPGQDTIVLTLSVELNSSLDTVDVSFQGFNAATGLLLYQGTQNLEVASSGQSPTPAPVTVAYVGPGQGLDSIIAAPDTVTLAPAATVQLTYTGYDNNLGLPDDSVPVRYASTDAAVARVNASGFVTAVANGVARIIVTSVAASGIKDTTTVTVATAPPPQIGLSVTSLTFNDTTGTANPAAQTVAVSNSGQGSLTGLAVGTITYGAGASGWLTATLNTPNAPATLTVNASNAGLAAGTYTATIPVTSGVATNSPRNVSVTYNVTALAPGSLVMSPGFRVFLPGQTQAVTLVAKDANGNVVSSAGTTFASRDNAVATVNAGGTITAVGNGVTRILANLGGVMDSISVVVASTGHAVLHAVADGRSFDVVKPGDTVRMLVTFDNRAVAPEVLGSYNAQFNWNPAILTYVRTDVVAGGFVAPVVNTTSAGTGDLRFGAVSANGQTVNPVGLATVVFVASGTGTASISSTITDLSAAGTFTQMLGTATIYTGTVKVQ